MKVPAALVLGHGSQLSITELVCADAVKAARRIKRRGFMEFSI
jgi:hypothetical protein